jgi:hypothetical protein
MPCNQDDGVDENTDDLETVGSEDTCVFVFNLGDGPGVLLSVDSGDDEALVAVFP